jgi:tRNA threonylcarbamoyl adenosine modification protein YeaZ
MKPLDDSVAGGAMLAIDTATNETIVGLQAAPDAPLVVDRWRSEHAHGERLLASVELVLDRVAMTLADIGIVAVATGPGSFTGLRIGLAAAKGLAFGLGIPLVGVPTPEVVARADAAMRSDHPPDGTLAGRTVVLQPAGPSGRYRTVVERAADGRWRAGVSELLTNEGNAVESTGAATVALDLPDAEDGALAAGEWARERLPDALIEAARERLAVGEADDLAALVPAYVSPPRGAIATNGSIAWSRGRR